MRPLREGWRRIRSLTRRGAIEGGLDEEIRFHIDQQTEKYVRAGMSVDEAHRQACVRFGGVERVKERTRDEFRPALVEDAVRDARYAVRALRRAPGFTAVCSCTLALSIGAASAVFSVINGVLIKRRRQELAVRGALGAGWPRIARQMFVEGLVLGALGGGLGLGLTVVSLRLLVAVGPAGLPRLSDVTVDPRWCRLR